MKLSISRTIDRLWAVVGVSLALVVTSLLAGPVALPGWTALATWDCQMNPFSWADVADFTSTPAHDGARATWELRALNEPNWNLGRKVTAELYFAIDGDTQGANNNFTYFVEVGEFDGDWQSSGSHYHGFFTMRFYDDNGTVVPGWHKFDTLDTTLGDIFTFTTHKTGSGYVRAQVKNETTGTVNYKTWDYASGPYKEWQVGTEFSCPTGPTSSADVYNNQYRRSSDSSWQYADAGNLERVKPQGASNEGSFDWCYQPQWFDFWLNASDPKCLLP